MSLERAERQRDEELAAGLQDSTQLRDRECKLGVWVLRDAAM